MTIYSSPLTQKVFALLGEGRADEALAAARETADPALSEEDERFSRLYLEAVVLSELKEVQGCFDALASLVDEGYPCPLYFQRFRPLRSLPEHTELWAANERNLAAHRARARMTYRVELPPGFRPDREHPLLLALHGDGLDGTIEDFREQWGPKEVLARGFIMVYVQSSYVIGHGFHGWMNDPERARRDVRQCLEEVRGRYPIDGERIVVGGFSGGAVAAVDIALTGAVPLRGIIAFSPSFRPASADDAHAVEAAGRGVRMFLAEGKEELPAPAEEEMLRLFERHGLAHRYLVHPGGHDVPADLPAVLDEAFSFVLGR